MMLGKQIAGFNVEGVNLLRHAVSKKVEAEFEILRPRFINGAMSNKTEDGAPKVAFTKASAEAIFHLIEGAYRYQFNKAHSASYALLAFTCAYLKAKYPACFAAGLLTHNQNKDKRAKTLLSLKRQGVEVLPPDVNVSGVAPQAVGLDSLTLGLGDIQSIGKAAKQIVDVRPEGGFESLNQFLDLVKPTSTQLYALINAGALDSFGPRMGLTLGAFGAEIPNVEFGPVELWARQLGALGVCVGVAHPLQALRGGVSVWLRRSGLAAGLNRLDSGASQVRTVVAVESVVKRKIKTGTMRRFVFSNSLGVTVGAIAWPNYDGVIPEAGSVGFASLRARPDGTLVLDRFVEYVPEETSSEPSEPVGDADPKEPAPKQAETTNGSSCETDATPWWQKPITGWV